MKITKGRNGGTLKTLEPGETLPGGGHPGGENFKTIARKFLDGKQKKKNPLTGKVEKLSGMEQLFLEIVSIAMNSGSDQAKIGAIREILDRVEGKVSQAVDVSGDISTRELIASKFPFALPKDDDE